MARRPHPYRALLAVPAQRAFVAAGFVGRLPMSMIGLGMVLVVEGASGSYGLAGLVAAVGAVAAAAAAPVCGGLIDRHGQRRVVPVMLAGHAAGLAATVVAANARAPTVVLLATAALAGAATPNVGALVRARWAHVLTRADRGPAAALGLQPAYALESVLDEVVFVVGPVSITALAVAASPSAALLATVVLTASGALALVAQRGSEPPPHPRARRERGSALRARGMPVLVGVFVAAGGIFGSVEVLTVAFAEAEGRPASAGFALAAFAGASMLAGVAYGALAPTPTLHRRFVAGAAALGLAVTVLTLAETVLVLGVLLFVAGFAISPMLIAGFGLVERLVPARSLTEGLTWVSAGIGVGLALGSAAGGRAADAVGPQRGLLVTGACGLAAATVAVAGSRLLRPVPDPGTAGSGRKRLAHFDCS